MFVKWLRENNLDAHELKTEFTGESIIATDDINDEKILHEIICAIII